jgi:hypothetical protein
MARAGNLKLELAKMHPAELNALHSTQLGQEYFHALRQP